MRLNSIAAARYTVVACGLAIALMGCATTQPQSTVSRDLDSGVTSNNGGGMMPANFGSYAPTQTSARTFDTGNMAYPEPLRQGTYNTTRLP